ncbi:uncharacterized protein LOC122503997 [Leptopilina heterotoma]|uniref:uncharacterized protein LOC122503997 n=1 Tax=Leptopilina heterotoma TaxID=63436 RepID=UPI001CAA407D|nr:uncharacterized protein LOC122503997 [Leptopilina heterotoma]
MIHVLIILVVLNAPLIYSLELEESITELAINISIDNIDRKFTLQSAKGFFAGKDTKVWLAKKNGNTFEYTLQNDVMEAVNASFHLYEIAPKKSKENDEGNSKFNKNRYTRDVSPKSRKKSANNNFKNHHVLSKREITELSNENNLHVSDKPNATTDDQSSEAPEIVYPEILVYVDKTLFEHFNNDIAKTVAYTLNFWNGVDLEFRDLEKPLVRLNIAGIILCQDQVIPMNNFVIEGTSLLNFARFMYNTTDQFELKEHYDFAVLLGTNYNRNVSINDDSIQGISYEKRICEKSAKCLGVTSTAIVTDNTAMSGIEVAVHELANLFGAFYEGDDEALKSTRPWKKSCMIKDFGTYPFSQCSKEMMSYFLSSKDASCLFNNPAVNRTDKQLLRVLPGKYVTYNEQCQKLGYEKASAVTVNICKSIKCYNSYNYEVTSKAVLEGTPCAINKYCLQRDCVVVEFDKNADNSGTKLLFPRFHMPGTNKSAETQCKERKMKNILSSYFDSCLVHCEFRNNKGKIRVRKIEAQLGTLCNANGFCKNMTCVQDTDPVISTIKISSDDLTTEKNVSNILGGNAANNDSFSKHYAHDEDESWKRDTKKPNDDEPAKEVNRNSDDYEKENFSNIGEIKYDDNSFWNHGANSGDKALKTAIKEYPSKVGENAGKDVANWGENTGNDVVNWGENAGKDVVNWGENAGKDVVNWGENAGKDVANWGENAGKDVVNWGENAGKDVANWGENAGKDVANWGENAGKDVANWGENAGKDVVNWGENAGKDVANWGENAGNDVVNWGENAGKDVVNWGENAGKDVANWGENAGKDVANWGENAGKDVVNWGENAGKDVANWGENAGKDVVNWGENVKNKLGDFGNYLNFG